MSYMPELIFDTIILINKKSNEGLGSYYYSQLCQPCIVSIGNVNRFPAGDFFLSGLGGRRASGSVW